MLPSLPQIPAPQKRKKSIKQMSPHSLRPMFKVLQEIFCKSLHYLAIILQETLQEGAQFCKINCKKHGKSLQCFVNKFCKKSFAMILHLMILSLRSGV
jgi:hypothetical protein